MPRRKKKVKKKKITRSKVPYAKLLAAAVHLYNTRPDDLTLAEMAVDTGLSLPWLKTFPKIKNPSVNLVERLYDYLAKKPLKVPRQ